MDDEDNETFFDKIGVDDENVLIKYIKSGKFNPTEKNDDGYTPLMVAIDLQYEDIAEAIIAKGNYNAAHSVGKETALSLAIKNEMENIAIKIVKAGDFNSGFIDNDGNTYLMMSIMAFFTKLSMAIIAKGNYNAYHSNNVEDTALIIAFKNLENINDYKTLIYSLIEGKEDCNFFQINGENQNCFDILLLSQIPESEKIQFLVVIAETINKRNNNEILLKGIKNEKDFTYKLRIEPPNETQLNHKICNNETAFDVIEGELIIMEILEQSGKNSSKKPIFISIRDQNYVIYMEDLKERLFDLIQFPCGSLNKNFIGYNFPLVYLNQLGIPFFVPLYSIYEIIERNINEKYLAFTLSEQIYQPYDVQGSISINKSILSLVSMSVYTEGNFVSGFHCQTGLDQYVHELIPIPITLPEKVNKKTKKIKRTYSLKPKPTGGTRRRQGTRKSSRRVRR